MSRSRHIAFLVLALFDFLLCAGAASTLLAANQSPLNPFSGLEDSFRGMSDDELLLLVAGLCGGAALFSGVPWALSLDPRRSRRPRLALYGLGLGPGLIAGAAVGAVVGGQAGMAGREAGIAAAATALATPLLLYLLEFVFSSISRGLSALSAKGGWLGLASFWARQWQRFSPSHAGLNPRIGLLDYRRGSHAEARRRLLPEFDEGRADGEVLAALWKMAQDGDDDDLILRLGEAFMAAGKGAAPSGKASVEDIARRRMSEARVRRGEFAKAIELLEPAIDRQNPADLETIAKLYLAERRWSSLEETLAALGASEAPPGERRHRLRHLVLERKDPATLDLLRREAAAMQSLKRPEEEAAILELVIELDAADSNARGRLIAMYRSAGRSDRLAVLLKAQLAHGDEEPDTALELIDLLSAARKQNEADEVAERFAGLHPEDHRFPLCRAKLALSAGSLDRAMAFLEDAEKLAGDAREALRPTRRKIEGAMDQREIESLEARVREDRTDLDAGLELVRRLARQGRHERASVEADGLVERLPERRAEIKKALADIVDDLGKNYLIATYLAGLMIADGEPDEAAALYKRLSETSLEPKRALREGAERILAVHSDHRPSREMMFDLCLEAKEWDLASENARAAMELGAEFDFESRSALFDCYCRMQNLEHGEPLGKALIDEQPYIISRVLQLAGLYIANDRFPEALALLGKAKEIEPGNNAIYAMNEQARSRQREKRSLELRQLIDKDPENAELLNELADVMVEVKRYEEALRFYQRAAQAAGEDEGRRLVCLTRLAWCMMKRHMFDSAVETLQEVPLRISEEKRVLVERKRLFYEVAEVLETNNHFEESLALYKQVFKVDAGFRHVLEKVEQLGR